MLSNRRGLTGSNAEMTPDASLDMNLIDGDQSISSEYEDAVSMSVGPHSLGHSGTSSSQHWHLDPQALTRAATMLMPTLPSSARVTLLSDLLMLLSSHELAQISSFVSSKLRIDFLSALPIEVSLHVLSFIDDPLTLARASQVNRFWRSLVNDEHTWEAMCLKYRYRYRRPSTVYPLRNRRASSIASPSHSPHTPTSDADLLASLYRRYRQRGLDPSNARNELRTLHDLFLAKQSADGGSGAAGESVTTESIIPEMSSADLRFYEQLEQIVQEESRERYGTEQHQRIRQDIAAIGSSARTPRNSTPVLAPSNMTSDGGATGSYPSSSNAAGGGVAASSSSSSHIGWLSTGPPATRFPRTPPANRSRLPPLTGVAARPPFEPAQSSRQRMVTPSRTQGVVPAGGQTVNPSVNGPLSSWTGGLALPWGLSDLIHLPSSLTGGAATSNATTPLAAGRTSPTVARGSTLGLGLPSDAATPSTQRAVTYGGPQQSSSSGAGAGSGKNQRFFSSSNAAAESFSYKNHFKRNYLTESNWHRGGRLLTHHVSSENGSVCTCTAMDQRWLVIGMANGKIHVFDARTGLYERTLGGGGTDLGVWCLALVSKTKGVRSASKRKGKGKARGDPDAGATAPGKAPKYRSRPAGDDARGDVEYMTAEHQIRLIDHDPLLAAKIEAGTEKEAAGIRGSGSPWFPMTRKAISRGVGSARSGAARAASSFSRSGGGGGGAAAEAPTETDMIDGYPRDMVEAGPEVVRESLMSAARDSSGEERARLETTMQQVTDALTRIRREHGITGKRAIPRPGRRHPHPEDDADVAMQDGEASGSGSGSGGNDVAMSDADAQDEVQFPADVRAMWSEFESESECDSDDEDLQEEYEGFSTGIGGSANGLGTLCGSTRGYGNDSALLVSGGCDRDVKVWDLSTGELKFTMHGHGSTVRCLRVLEGRPIAVSGGRDSTVRVWDISTGQLLRVLAGHQNSVRCLEVAGNRVATGSYDCTCRIWDVDSGECQHVLRGHYNQIYCVAFDGNKVATGSLDSTVRVWSAATGEPLALLQGHTALVGTLQLSNNILVSGGSDGRILVYSLLDMTLLYAICAHDNSVSCFQFDEHFIVTGGNDGAVRLWNLFDGSFIRQLTKPMHSVWKLAFRDDKVLALCKREDESLSMELFDFRPVE